MEVNSNFVVIGGLFAPKLEADGTNISREEYYPFGETSFGSYAKKRYRYCGKERDEESGMYYYEARYYSCWSCRFVNVDPNCKQFPYYTSFQYSGNNPISCLDIDGLEDIYFMKSTQHFRFDEGVDRLFKTELAENFIIEFQKKVDETSVEGESLDVDHNKGYDLFVTAYTEGLYSSSGGFTEVVDLNDEMYAFDENGKFIPDPEAEDGLKSITKEEGLFIALEKGSGPYYDYFKRLLTAEVLESQALRDSLIEGRNIIIVGVNLEFASGHLGIGEAFSERSTDVAYALGHELLGHALSASRGPTTAHEDHLKFNQMPEGTIIAKGSDGEKLYIQLKALEQNLKK